MPKRGSTATAVAAVSAGSAATAASLDSESGGEPHVRLDDVTLKYGVGQNALTALQAATLEIGRGEFVALVGPSGCGKSTILRLVGELLRPTDGTVQAAHGEEGARFGMAFQNATLLPWLTIRQNVMLPLKIVQPFRREFRAKRKTEFRAQADELLDQVGLSGFGDKHPWQLSGGMLQRASLCRALIHHPSLLLLDEPFAALDQFTREELWNTLQQLWITHRPTILMVTHDLREAVYLATRLYIMRSRPGRIVGSTVIPFSRPRTLEITYDPVFTEIVHYTRNKIDEGRTA